MKTQETNYRGSTFAMLLPLFLFLVTLYGVDPLAQAKSININPLLTGINSSYLGLEDASLSDQPYSNKRTPGRNYFSASYHWDNAPWIRLNADKNKEIEPVVASMQTIDLGWSWLLSDDMQLGFQTFGSMVAVAPQYGGENKTHMGDSRVQFKYRFLTDTFWSMAIAPEITLPTGVEYTGHRYGASLSNSSFGPGLKFIGEYRTNQNQWTFNLGYAYFDQAEFKSPNGYPQIDGRSRIFLGMGWLHRLNRKWSLDSEFSSQMPGGENHFTPPGLLTMGGRYQHSKTLAWHFGLGTGGLGSTGGNDPIVYVGFKRPFFGSSSKNANSLNSSEDPLLQEAYKKNLIDDSSDRSKLRPEELDPYLNSTPEDEKTNSSLFTPDSQTSPQPSSDNLLNNPNEEASENTF